MSTYVAKAYGPTYVRTMLQAFADQQGWQPLIYVVFKQSPAEFMVNYQKAYQGIAPTGKATALTGMTLQRIALSTECR